MSSTAKVDNRATLWVLFSTLLFVPLGPDTALAFAFTAVAAWWLFQRGRREGELVALALAMGFLLRASVVAAYEYGRLLPYTWDDYSIAARSILENLRSGSPLFAGVGGSVQLKSYALFRAAVNLLLGQARIFVMLANALLMIFGCLRIYEICCRSGLPQRVCERLLAVLVLLPSGIVFSSLDMRDSLIFFLTWDALWRLTKERVRLSWLEPPILLAELVALGLLRHFNLLIYAGAAVIVLLVGMVQRRAWGKLIGIGGAAVIALFSLKTWIRGFADFLLAYADAEVRYRATGGSAYVVNVGYTSWANVLRFLPARFVHFTFGPFLWSAHGSFLLAAGLESLLVLIFVAPGLLNRHIWAATLRNPRLFCVVAVSVLGLLGSAVVDSNYGTAIRHRLLFLPGLFLLGSMYWYHVDEQPAHSEGYRASTTLAG